MDLNYSRATHHLLPQTFQSSQLLEHHILFWSFHTNLLILIKDGCEPCKLLSFHFRSNRLVMFLFIFLKIRTFCFNLGHTYQ